MRFPSVLLFLFLSLALRLSAQHAPASCWTQVLPGEVVLSDKAYREFEPHDYAAYRLDYNALVASLQQAPLENTPAAGQHPLVIQLPNADGRLETYALVESPVMMSRLQAENPQTRTFKGHSMQTPGKILRCMYSPTTGFSAMFSLPDKGVEYLEPLAREQNTYYMAYNRRSIPNELYPAERGTLDVSAQDKEYLASLNDLRAHLPEPRPSDRGTLSAPVIVKEYRFAVATTVEFSADHGGTVDAVFDRVVNYTNRISLVYERDLNIKLTLVNDEKKIIFVDAATSPFSGSTVFDWMSQNALVVNSKVGSSNYDVGHVFARYLGGGAAGVAGGLGTVCTQLKARGCSAGGGGLGQYGDYFVGVVGQEVGHQLNGGHTWTYCDDKPGDFPGSACEPGSGSTIMSYAGTCGQVDNVQSQADLYFHACSIIEIRSFVEIGAGATCGNNINTGNNAPVVTIPYPNNMFIPISTPFELTGTAVDSDGDPLTYSWEEIDAGPLVHLGSPTGNTAVFRVFPAVSSPTRTFPRLQNIITGTSDKREILPTYTRDLSFALVARDAKVGGGGVGLDTLRMKATELAGPFQVLNPNSTTSLWAQGQYYTVVWDVSNTNKAPVNCKVVNIRLSTDGGFTYPILLASKVANTGRYCVKAPSLTTNTARIRIEAADNVFFDISNANFKIQAATVPGFTFCPAKLFDTICLPAQYTTVISTSSAVSFNEPITLSVSGLPAGATATISPNPVLPGSDAVLNLEVPANQPEGAFDIRIIGVAGALADSLVNTISVFYNNLDGLALQSPLNGAAGQDRAPVLRWVKSANANTYEVQVASNPSFASGTLVSSKDNIAVDSFKIPILLDKGEVFYWRFRGKNECGTGPWIGPFVFATLVDACTVLESNDVPKNITSNSATTVESKIVVPAGGIISDVNITKVQGNHSFFKDLEMHLISPTGTDVLLFKDKCPNFNGNFNFGFDDSKPALFGCPPPNNGSTYKPTQALGAFNGQDSGGDWILRVKDNVISSGGAIQAFSLELCSSTSLNPPVLVNNNLMQVVPGTNKAVSIDLLKTTDSNNSDNELVYTLLSLPQHGQLQLFWTGALAVGAQFTQTDLNNNGLRYFDYGNHSVNDEFCFTVTDGEGGLIKDCFTIQPFPVSTTEPGRAIDFYLAPNPATESVRLVFPESVQSDTRVRLFDMSGRLLQQDLLLNGQSTVLLELTDLPDGIYTVQVDNAQGSGVRKVMVR
ncbi:MAG: T9SS type A sorting domain-containing protein [Saprospiraceae bacterium]|nr:T9SS type A sorting domain-containing protein [Saprospiraceae bacterium]